MCNLKSKIQELRNTVLFCFFNETHGELKWINKKAVKTFCSQHFFCVEYEDILFSALLLCWVWDWLHLHLAKIPFCSVGLQFVYVSNVSSFSFTLYDYSTPANTLVLAYPAHVEVSLSDAIPKLDSNWPSKSITIRLPSKQYIILRVCERACFHLINKKHIKNL